MLSSSDTVRVVPYDEDWPGRYEAEAKRIREALGPIAVEIHHIGSTAVPGLAAKPIIDILARTTSMATWTARIRS